ncbi:hypothetical protein ACMXYQ_13295 [Neptuniibacter sp. PT34_22]|uniref:hypothetical protein n=1 Tax=Neptuniibacter sp. PT34_22 TaxID=3398205 RepID=UPI0039F51F0B
MLIKRVDTMQPTVRTRAIAVVTVDGENYEIDGCYQGKQRKASWFNVIKTSDRKIQVEHLDEFPSPDKIREILN